MSPKGEEAKPQPEIIYIQALWMSPKGEEAKPQTEIIYI
jgi:hypothetical protein